MKNDMKKKAGAFLKEHKLREVTLGDLRKIIEKQGYTIVEFHPVYNEEPVETLINVLGIREQIEKTKGFTYADRQRRLVFVHEDLSETEKRLVLAHEEGHIYCGHLSSVPILGRDVMEEYEANEFTHYILKNGLGRKVGYSIRKHKLLVGVMMAMLIGGGIFLGVQNATQKEQSYYGEYYLTSSGDKYHKRECIFVKDKTNIHRISVEEFESGAYEPCDICLPLETQ